MIYLSAGHHFNPSKNDPGAVANGHKESDLTVMLRELIAKELIALKASFILDKDEETLSQYISRIKPGSGSVVLDLHFNAAVNSATGIETLVKRNAKSADLKFAEDINNATVKVLGLRDRGVKSEAESARGRLAMLNTNSGLSALLEVCFITNKSDLDTFLEKKEYLAKELAKVLVEHDNKFK